MTIRPPLKFDVIRPEVKYYFRFDPATGRVLGCSIQKKENSIEISEELGKQVQSRLKQLGDYLVVLEDNQYVVKAKNAVDSKQHSNKESYKIENKIIYEIQKNDKDSCIRFELNKRNSEWNITIDDELKDAIKNTANQKSIHKFFTTPQDNTSVLDYSFELDIEKLCQESTIKIPHQSDSIPRLFCRKVHNYSYEVSQ